MKRKYFAYLHENDHWVVKNWTTKQRFMEIFRDGLSIKNSCVKGIIFPFELDIPLEPYEEKAMQEADKNGGLIWIKMSDVEPRAVKDHPGLLHIKAMINRIDWNKG